MLKPWCWVGCVWGMNESPYEVRQNGRDGHEAGGVLDERHGIAATCVVRVARLWEDAKGRRGEKRRAIRYWYP